MKKHLFILCVAALAAPALVSAANDGIDPAFTYAWSENSGWVNFNALLGDVSVSDTGMSGYAWGANIGWINLHPTESVSVHNDGAGKLSGFVWGASTGYIDFSGVSIGSDGFFHGYANGSTTGRISFNCANTGSCALSDFKVRTEWRPAAGVASSAVSGGGTGVVAPVSQAEQASSTATAPTSPALGQEEAPALLGATGAAAARPPARIGALFDVVVSPAAVLPTSYRLWWLVPLSIALFVLIWMLWQMGKAFLKQQCSARKQSTYE